MPTYEYACKSCGQHIEVVQAFTDDSLTTCQSCGGDLRKVFGAIGITFKGSGFYKNDSRESKPSSTHNSTGDTKTEPAKTSESKTSDTKSSETKSSEGKSSSSSDSAKAS